jgi:hypothetical protein
VGEGAEYLSKLLEPKPFVIQILRSEIFVCLVNVGVSNDPASVDLLLCRAAWESGAEVRMPRASAIRIPMPKTASKAPDTKCLIRLFWYALSQNSL